MYTVQNKIVQSLIEMADSISLVGVFSVIWHWVRVIGSLSYLSLCYRELVLIWKGEFLLERGVQYEVAGSIPPPRGDASPLQENPLHSNKQYYNKLLLSVFHLNDDNVGFQ